MRSATWFFGLLGAVFSTVALVSLCSKILHIGLVPVAADIIASYRAVVHPVMTVLLGWIHWIRPQWTIPEWLKDAYALSFVGGFGIARGLGLVDEESDALVKAVTVGICGAFFGASFLGLIALLLAPVWWYQALFALQTPVRRRTALTMALSTLGALFGGVLFFALNYGAFHGWNWGAIFS